jgi:STE24 endopeptidase
MRAVGSGRYGLATLACVLCSLTAATPRTAPAQAIAEQAVSAAAVPNAAAPTTHPAHQRITSRQAFDAEEAMEAYLATLDEETRTRSKEYTEGGYWLGIISLFYGLAVAFFLLNTGLSARMRDIAERISGRKPLQTALYGVQYILVTTLLLLPLSAYSGFIREHRYGFSTQSVGGYISDRFIGLAISLVLVSILLVLLYGAIRRARRTWWIWGAGVSLGFLAVIAFISPVYLAPLFNQYEPLEEGSLKDRILAMARANGVPADEVYRYDASKRTTKISANVSGFLGTTRISLNDNLLDRGTDEEIEAVMAHEIGHFALNAAGEIFVFFGIVLIVGFAFVRWGFDRALARWGSGWGVRDVGDVAGLPLFLVLFSLYSAAITPITNGFIRSNEVEADIYGLNAAREPDGFSTIILKLGEYRKVDPGPLEEWLFYDHPSARNRILMAMRWKAEQPEYRRD